MTTKIKYFVIYLPLMIMVLALSGCGIPQDQYDQLKSELTSFQQQLGELNTLVEDLTKTNGELENSLNNSTKLNEELNANIEGSARLNEELASIAAYSLWYDYYYGTGAYSFNGVTAFNSQLGSLIAAIDDTNSRSAFEVYYATHYDYTTLVASLPEDNIWTLSQYESWRDAGQSRKEALGQVGGHLFNKIKTIPWFEVE